MSTHIHTNKQFSEANLSICMFLYRKLQKPKETHKDTAVYFTNYSFQYSGHYCYNSDTVSNESITWTKEWKSRDKHFYKGMSY